MERERDHAPQKSMPANIELIDSHKISGKHIVDAIQDGSCSGRLDYWPAPKIKRLVGDAQTNIP
jgi:hypothetical protein